MYSLSQIPAQIRKVKTLVDLCVSKWMHENRAKQSLWLSHFIFQQRGALLQEGVASIPLKVRWEGEGAVLNTGVLMSCRCVQTPCHTPEHINLSNIMKRKYLIPDWDAISDFDPKFEPDLQSLIKSEHP